MEDSQKDNSALTFLIILVLATIGLALLSGFKRYENSDPAQIINYTFTEPLETVPDEAVLKIYFSSPTSAETAVRSLCPRPSAVFNYHQTGESLS